jgi:hypothetical protein
MGEKNKDFYLSYTHEFWEHLLESLRLSPTKQKETYDSQGIQETEESYQQSSP